MISTDFSPLETRKDAFVALNLLFRPWSWRQGKKAGIRVKNRLKKYAPKHEVALFLTARGALYKTLEALEVRVGDEVIVVPFTCEAVIVPILAHGAVPVYVDIEPVTYSIDAKLLEAKISKKTRAIILQHTYGALPMDREAVVRIARGKRITVIEDLAHGWDNAYIQNHPLSTIKLFSFGRSKALSSVWGGAVAVSSPSIATKLKNLERQLDQPSYRFIMRALWYKPLSVFIKRTYEWGFGPVTVGRITHAAAHLLGLIMNELSPREKQLKMDPYMIKAYPEAFAQLLLTQLTTFEQIQANRLSICSLYNQYFPSSTRFEAPLSRYPMTVAHRDRLVAMLRHKSIYVGQWYRKLMGDESSATCRIANRATESIINLPTNITMIQAERIVSALEKAQTSLKKTADKHKKK